MNPRDEAIEIITCMKARLMIGDEHDQELRARANAMLKFLQAGGNICEGHVGGLKDSAAAAVDYTDVIERLTLALEGIARDGIPIGFK